VITDFERYSGMYILKIFCKKDYDPVILQRTSCLVIVPSIIDSHAFLFGFVVTDRV